VTDSCRQLPCVNSFLVVYVFVCVCVCRILGGLLSAHQLALQTNLHTVTRTTVTTATTSASTTAATSSASFSAHTQQSSISNVSIPAITQHNVELHTTIEYVYDGTFLLDLAVDIGNRLLPAFSTKTGSCGC
jgi:alanine dehydrogenase